MSGSLFHVLQDCTGCYYLQGNQADKPCLKIGTVDFELVERIHAAIEAAWRNDEAWRSGKMNNEIHGAERTQRDNG